MPKKTILLSERFMPVALLTLSASSMSAQADFTKEVEDALSFYDNGNKGKLNVDLRYRYENVNQDQGNQKTANANTTRLRLGYLTPTFYDLQAFAEYEGNYAMQEDYNSLRNGRTQYSVVADPDESELNQFWLSYKGIPDTLAKVGRQRIKLDDDRFIGNVGWRQMEMTYDSVLLTNQSLPNLTVKAGYIDSARTILSTKEKMNSPILNLNYKVGEWGDLIGYGYWLDFREQENYAKSSQSYGLGFKGESPKFYDTVSAVYDVEWSNQSNYGDNPNHYQVDRIKLLGGATAYNATVSGAMEQLNGLGYSNNKVTNNGSTYKSFQTPLGTNHAFQGWADLFLTTPANGIRDVFATADYKMMNKSLIFTGVYHDFFDDTGVTHYGNEWDFSVMKKFGKHYSLLAKYAYYNADTFGTDTQKIWLEADVSF